jgi:hypothetical protein
MDQMNLLLVAVVARKKWDRKFNEKKGSFLLNCKISAIYSFV